MHGSPCRRTGRPADPSTARRAPANAVVWIGPGQAVVVRGGDGPELASTRIELPEIAGATPPALAEVAHAIGRVDRVLVLGSDELRTALEREIVAIGHRPDIITDDPAPVPLDEAALAERLAGLR